jgi:hypothetical protein
MISPIHQPIPRDFAIALGALQCSKFGCSNRAIRQTTDLPVVVVALCEVAT